GYTGGTQHSHAKNQKTSTLIVGVFSRPRFLCGPSGAGRLPYVGRPASVAAREDTMDTHQALAEAIQKHANALWGGDLVVDWVLVTALTGTETLHSIGVEESRENMPAYITTGLLHEAIKLGIEYE